MQEYFPRPVVNLYQSADSQCDGFARSFGLRPSHQVLMNFQAVVMQPWDVPRS